MVFSSAGFEAEFQGSGLEALGPSVLLREGRGHIAPWVSS